MTDSGFDPRRAVDEHPSLRVLFHPVAQLLGGGFHVARSGRAFIVIDPELDEAGRRAVLTHELVHHERGHHLPGSAPRPLLEAATERDERAVRGEVARRLVPPDQLAQVVVELVDTTGSASVADVAERFSVPGEVAELALHQLVGPRP